MNYCNGIKNKDIFLNRIIIKRGGVMKKRILMSLLAASFFVRTDFEGLNFRWTIQRSNGKSLKTDIGLQKAINCIRMAPKLSAFPEIIYTYYGSYQSYVSIQVRPEITDPKIRESLFKELVDRASFAG